MIWSPPAFPFSYISDLDNLYERYCTARLIGSRLLLKPPVFCQGRDKANDGGLYSSGFSSISFIGSQ